MQQTCHQVVDHDHELGLGRVSRRHELKKVSLQSLVHKIKERFVRPKHDSLMIHRLHYVVLGQRFFFYVQHVQGTCQGVQCSTDLCTIFTLSEISELFLKVMKVFKRVVILAELSKIMFCFYLGSRSSFHYTSIIFIVLFFIL
ncbi:hypothetical protein [Salmon gill poxvirus]|nr:hypothetical protein [Salmon gill poxvirus]